MARRQLAPDWTPQLPVATDMMEWQIVRGSRVPGPGNYKIKDEIADRIRGGRFGRNITKSNLELMIDRVKNDPAPHDYDVNKCWESYLDRKKGGVMAGRNSGPAVMPAGRSMSAVMRQDHLRCSRAHLPRRWVA